MEPFSKLRPPDAIRIKAKLAESDDSCSINSNLSTLTSSIGTCSSHSLLFKNSKKFCVDPQVTSYEILIDVLSQAFGLREEFKMSYLNRESSSDSSNMNENSKKEEYISLYSDWDLDAAFLNSSKPFLAIILTPTSKINSSATPSSKSGIPSLTNDDWDVITAHDLKPFINTQLPMPRLNIDKSSELSNRSFSNRSGSFTYNSNRRRSLFSTWSVTADKAVSVFQKVFKGFSRSNSFTSNSNSSIQSNIVQSFNSSANLSYSQYNPHAHLNASPLKQQTESVPIDHLFTNYSKIPLSDSEFRNFIDSDGRIVMLTELRQRIFDGGCEPSKRKELWPILLDIYPNQSMTYRQRDDFISQKSIEYNQLKSSLWFNLNKSILKNQKMFNIFDVETAMVNTDQSSILANKIQKDVWRTDRYHKFYAGDLNKNVESLFNILMTYSLSNGGFYAQGMSDLLSPLLYVIRDEPLTFLCFQALMKRCACNFGDRTEEITNTIGLLTSMIARYDPVFWMYLSQFGADQLYFTYRWLLIECKREFPFNDSLRVFEVMWSTIEAQKVLKINSNNNYLSQNFKRRTNSDSSQVNISKLRLNKTSPSNQCVDDYLISDVEYSDTNCLESSSVISNERLTNKNKPSTPSSNSSNVPNKNAKNNEIIISYNEAENNSNSNNNTICEICLLEKKQLIKKKLDSENEISNDEKKEITSSSEESSVTSTCSDLESLDENDDKDLDKSELKLNRQRWRIYRRAQQANKMRTRRPRYFSLNILMDKIATTKRKNLDSDQNKSHQEHDSENAEKQSERVGLCLLNLEIKKRQLEDKYETNNATPLLATNYLLNKSTPHSCSVKKKLRSSSLNCIDCLGSQDQSNTEKQNIYKRRNSMFHPTDEDLLSTLPRLMKLNASNSNENKTEEPYDLARNRSSLDFERAEPQDTHSNKSSQKKKFRKKTSQNKKTKDSNRKLLIKSFNSASNSKFESNKIEDKKTSEPGNHLPLAERRSTIIKNNKKLCKCSNSIFNSEEGSSNDNLKEKLTSSPNSGATNDTDLQKKRSKSSATSAVGSSISSLSSNCSTPFLGSKQVQNNQPILESTTNSHHNNIFRNTENLVSVTPVTYNTNTNLAKSVSFNQPSILTKTEQLDDDLEEDLISSLSKLDNPFLLFLCFSILIEHRDHIMRLEMDSNDIACYFDKMARKHNMKTVLNRARYLYTKLYLSRTNAFSYMQQLNEIQNSP